MFVILLKFADQRARAPEYMAAHKDWLQRGFDDGVFLVSGNLDSGGGGILAHNTSLDALRARVDEDPFVAHGVVSAQVIGIAPSRAVRSWGR